MGIRLSGIRDTILQAMKAAGKRYLVVDPTHVAEAIHVVSEANNHEAGRTGWFEQELKSIRTHCGEGLLSQREGRDCQQVLCGAMTML